MNDWLTPEERKPVCDCPTGANVLIDHYRCATDNAPSYDELLSHAVEADRRIAERDDVIRKLAAALRRYVQFQLDAFNVDAPSYVDKSLARVDALNGGAS